LAVTWESCWAACWVAPRVDERAVAKVWSWAAELDAPKAVWRVVSLV
jgi:hypothetical protein